MAQDELTGHDMTQEGAQRFDGDKNIFALSDQQEALEYHAFDIHAQLQRLKRQEYELEKFLSFEQGNVENAIMYQQLDSANDFQYQLVDRALLKYAETRNLYGLDKCRLVARRKHLNALKDDRGTVVRFASVFLMQRLPLQSFNPRRTDCKVGVSSGEEGTDPPYQVTFHNDSSTALELYRRAFEIKLAGVVHLEPDTRPMCKTQPPATEDDVQKYNTRVAVEAERSKNSAENLSSLFFRGAMKQNQKSLGQKRQDDLRKAQSSTGKIAKASTKPRKVGKDSQQDRNALLKSLVTEAGFPRRPSMMSVIDELVAQNARDAERQAERAEQDARTTKATELLSGMVLGSNGEKDEKLEEQWDSVKLSQDSQPL
ncbi:uncharacterized protein RCC_08857 [Ramularia collo-cygni]|uniref:Uncharacterized protein n=1 Tax=Ramularia collo-cygni TaxID=112498 RepID=A0A2D3UYJ3_9PEZI|nr:uncharacterized protein RCC_08857 [Ramularia collo-cygni]CZT23147.1 uncharacterized protein RCC_08857 [Ramularia collo-cygni]